MTDLPLSLFSSPATLKWRYSIGSMLVTSFCDENVYIGDENGLAYVISNTGTLKWSFYVGPTIVSSAAVRNNGDVYFGVGSTPFNPLLALSSSGTRLWRLYVSGGWGITSSPIIGNDGTVYAGSTDYSMYAISSSGTIRWSYDTGYPIDRSNAVLSNDGNTLYFGSRDYFIHAVSTSTGVLSWRYLVGDTIQTSLAISEDGLMLYFGSRDCNLYALSSSAGTLKWRYKTDGFFSSSPAISKDGTVYVASDDSYVYSLSSSGTLRWRYNNGGSMLSSLTLDENGIVYAISSDGYLYALGGSAGTLIWRYFTVSCQSMSYLSHKSSLSVDNERRTLYVAPCADYLYAFEIKDSPPYAPDSVPLISATTTLTSTAQPSLAPTLVTPSTPTLGHVSSIVYTFTESGNFSVASAGIVVYLVVGGGGAGGSSRTDRRGSGGGGAGGVVYGSMAVQANTDYSVVVGAGGAPVSWCVTSPSGCAGGNGGDSSFHGIVAYGGGGGGNVLGSGSAGGSGGGAGDWYASDV